MTIYGDGSQTRSFCFYTDLIEGIVRLLQSPLHDPVNLGNPQENTILELAESIRSLVGSQSRFEFKPLPSDDPLRRQPDITRAVTLLGWRPSVSLEEGLRQTIDWFRTAPRHDDHED